MIEQTSTSSGIGDHTVGCCLPDNNSDRNEDQITQSVEQYAFGHVKLNDPSSVGLWCLTIYDSEVYPGIITSCEDEVEVKTMNKIGQNRFIWPQREDKIWYNAEHIIGIIPEPQKVSKRRDIFQIEPKLWKASNDHI